MAISLLLESSFQRSLPINADNHWFRFVWRLNNLHFIVRIVAAIRIKQSQLVVSVSEAAVGDGSTISWEPFRFAATEEVALRISNVNAKVLFAITFHLRMTQCDLVPEAPTNCPLAFCVLGHLLQLTNTKWVAMALLAVHQSEWSWLAHSQHTLPGN